MNPPPAWLPAILELSPWTLARYDELYAIFEHDLKFGRPVYDGKEVWFFPEMDDGKETVFWHLTSREDHPTKERNFDFRRSERLPWVRPMLDHAAAPEILAWDYQEDDGSIRTYVWLRDWDFLVLMKKMRNGSRRLITSYWIDYPNKRTKLHKKYEARLI